MISDYAHILRPHQCDPAARLHGLLDAGHLGICDLSDTGTGKTFQNMAVIASKKKATLVVVPKIAETAWRNCAKVFGEGISVVSYDQLRLGRSGFGWWDNNPPVGFTCDTRFKCTICQNYVDYSDFKSCDNHPAGIHCVEVKKVPWSYGRFNYHPGVELLVFDEAHRLAAGNSLNSDMGIAARRQRIPSILISATLGDSPLDFRATGFMLGLHNLGNYYDWSRQFGCGKIDGLAGWHWAVGKDKRQAAMEKLNRLLLERGVRVRTADIPGFPDRTLNAELYDLDDYGGVDALYAEMEEAMKAVAERRLAYKDAEAPLQKILNANQQLELLKVPLFVELTQDKIAKGHSVGIFVKYQRTIDELSKRLKTKCIIDGKHTGARRDKNIAAFVADDERVVIVQADAGGVACNLQDLHGNHPRSGLLGPNVGARTAKQVFGRFHRDGAKTPCFYTVVLTARTCEQKTFTQLQTGLQHIDTLNDGHFLPFGD